MNTSKNNTAIPVSERYQYDIDLSTNTAATQVIRLTGERKSVLELGPGPGTILRYLAQHQQCTVSAVELDPACADALQGVCQTVVQGDLNQSDWLQAFAGQRFDVIIAADVLEHLQNPWQCLRDMRSLLTPDGYAVISIPNVGHNSVLASLMTGRFPYQPRGLLDQTHLRFFTRHDFEQVLFECGLLPSHWFAIQKPAAEAELGHHWTTLNPMQQQMLNANPYGNDYQYVVRAYASEEAGYIAKTQSLMDDTHAVNVRQLEEIKRLTSLLDNKHEKISELLRQFELQDRHYLQLLSEKDQSYAMRTQEFHVAIKKQHTLSAQIGQQQQDIEETRHVVMDLQQQLRQADTRIEELWNSTSWKITKPVRALGRLFGGISLHTQLRRAYRGMPVPVQSVLNQSGITAMLRNHLPATESGQNWVCAVGTAVGNNPFDGLFSGSAPDGIEDVFFWGVIDWHFRFQRPQQLAIGFHQRHHRVFYISSELVNRVEPGYQVEAIAGKHNVFQIRLYANSAPPIYHHSADSNLLRQLQIGFAMLLQDAGIKDLISIVQHPFWLPMARSAPSSRLVYDCMDHHEGFGNCPPDVIAGERALMAEADTLIVTSDWLYNIAKDKNPNTFIVRNACEFRHFSQRPTDVYCDQRQRKILGYFGAISDWFDCNIVAQLAKHFPECLILLVGADTCGAAKKLAKYSNIVLTGEVPYQQLPHYLYAFDVCILPFQIIDLTLATNPVKVYEYMCSGKPVVSVQLPELASMHEMVYLAEDGSQFIAHCELALKEVPDAPQRQKRINYASEQTWVHRAAELESALEQSQPPLVSIVVVTYNNLNLTQLCLASIETETIHVRYEIIIVDNASSDGTQDYLQQFAAGKAHVSLILNDDNTGFSKANNQGLAQAKGDYLVVLNNDTVVTRGWASSLIRHCRKNPEIGLIGPVTNNIGNEAKIDIQYDSLDEMPTKAREYTLTHLGQSFDIRTLAFFCVMITRETYDQIGGLDEEFGLGFFEDDDYCRRVETAKFRIVCADDVFVHHNLSASFNKLGQERKQELFLKNKVIYEAKWGKWIPHSYRI